MIILKEKVETKLLGTSPSLPMAIKLIGEYFYSNNISLNQVNDNEWEISNAKGVIKGHRVIKLKGRYRFERIL
jgi:hypothetical protein